MGFEILAIKKFCEGWCLLPIVIEKDLLFCNQSCFFAHQKMLSGSATLIDSFFFL